MSTFTPQKGMSEAAIESLIDQALIQLSTEEKVEMMSGHGFFKQFKDSGGTWCAEPYRAGGGCERLQIPALYFTDGPRGVANGNATCFPASMARGASWDVDLERRIGEVMGMEARAQGCTLSGAVCVNLLRHPGWGRAQETYGEDPYHVGELGAALATGIQTHNVVASAKHFALNSIENARFKVDVRIDPRTLREVYLAHFKRIIDTGCASVMSAYNKMNGEYCGQNRHLLTDILRHEWGFDGFVHSDWVRGVYHPYGAAAGLDVENPEPIHFGAKLVAAVENGHIEPAVLDTAVRRIMRITYRFACAQDPLESYPKSLVACDGHRALAKEAAEKSAVLLTNDGLLPLSNEQSIAVFGRLANLKNTGDNGSSRVRPPYVITALAGLADYLGDESMTVAGDESDVDAAAAAAGNADVAIVVVGYTADNEGEYIPGDIDLDGNTNAAENEQAPPTALGGDREVLRLPADQVAMIQAIAEKNSRTIVVVISGSAVLMSEWSNNVSAIMQTFYSGMEGGSALASLLYGEVSPSAKLPFSVAASEEDYPFFDRNADTIDYEYWHGYSLLEREQKQPAFAFGHGLSYTQFSYRGLRARRGPRGLQVQVTLHNTGDCAGAEIAQLYIGFPGDRVDRPAKLLRGFARVTVQPGEARTVHFEVPEEDLKYWHTESAGWLLEAGRHRVLIGGSSRDADLLSTEVSV